MRFPHLCLLFTFVAFFQRALSQTDEQPPAPKLAAYSIPEKTDDGWEPASRESAGIAAGPIDQLLERLSTQSYKNIHSIVLVRNGKLVLEQYYAGKDQDGNPRDFQRDTLHTIQSCTKSVNSILIGIALDWHLITGVEEKMSAFFPQAADLFTEGKESLSLRDCLSMSAGLRWVESGFPYIDPRNDAYGLNRSSDPVRYVFNRPLAEPPHTRFLYNSGVSIMLGEVVHQATGQFSDQLAEQALFGPLGIKDYRWGKLPNGFVHTGGGLFLRPRDMAKIGFLYLNGGRWQEKQIVSESWVRESTKQQAPYKGYGYQWWLRSFRLHDRETEAFAAQGLGGQFIIVLPDLQLVAVFTGWNIDNLVEQPFDMLQQYIIPAIDQPTTHS